jgi:hypothetical protein
MTALDTTPLDGEELFLSPAEAELLRILEERLRTQDLDLDPTTPLDEVADRMVAAIPQSSSPWSEVLGPVYTARTLGEFLGITRQAISQAAQSLTMLRITTKDGRAVFPAFQFAADGSRVPGLRDVLRALKKGIDDPLTWAQWLTAKPGAGLSQLDRLWAGNVAGVLGEAQRTASAWAA